MSIDRKLELDKLLGKLRKSDPNNDSDIDLILKYLEQYLALPEMSRGSKKLLEFEIKDDINTFSKIYHITWKRTDVQCY